MTRRTEKRRVIAFLDSLPWQKGPIPARGPILLRTGPGRMAMLGMWVQEGVGYWATWHADEDGLPEIDGHLPGDEADRWWEWIVLPEKL